MTAKSSWGLALAFAAFLAASFANVGASHAAQIPFDLNSYGAETMKFAQGGLRTPLRGGCDVTGDGLPDLIAGAPSETVGGTSGVGRVFIVPGDSSRGGGSYEVDGGSSSAGAIVIEGDPSMRGAGESIDCAGDVNDDGIDDILIGAAGASESRAYVVFGDSTLASSSPIDLAALGGGGFEIEELYDYGFGVSVAGIGDIDEDGKSDFAVHSMWGQDPPTGSDYFGTTYVIDGRSATSAVSVTDPGAALAKIQGAVANELMRDAEALAGVGDVDGDGTPDLAIGSPNFDGPNGADTGAVFVVSGEARGDVDLAADPQDPSVLLTVFGADPAARGSGIGRTGEILAPAGDINADGRADLLIGSRSPHASVIEPVHGLASVVFGGGGGEVVDIADLGEDGYNINGVETTGTYDLFGSSVAAAGDVDGDGLGDFIVGAPQHDSTENRGAAYLLYGRDSAEDQDIEGMSCEQGARLLGDGTFPRVGSSVVSAGVGFSGDVAHLAAAGQGGLSVIPLADRPGSCGEDPEPPAKAHMEVDWGFRENFRNYIYNGWQAANPVAPILAEAGASCDPTPETEKGGCDPKVDAAHGSPQRAIRWQLAGAGATNGSDTTIAGKGRVTFSYPAHSFTFRIEDPWIKIDNETATLRARVKLDVTEEGSALGVESSDSRVPVASFPLAEPVEVNDDYVRWSFGAGSLTEEAGAALGTFLGAGSELDPLRVTIPRSLGGLPEEPGLPIDQTPDGDQKKPRISALLHRKAMRVSGRSQIKLLRVRCGDSPCRVRAGKHVRTKTKGAGRGLRIKAPKRLGSERSKAVSLVVSRRFARALRGRSARLRVRTMVKSEDGRAAKTVRLKLRSPRRR